MKVVSYSSGFPDLLQEINSTLVMTSRKRGRVFFLSADATGPRHAHLQVPGLLDLTARDERMALICSNRVVEFQTVLPDRGAGHHSRNLKQSHTHRADHKRLDYPVFLQQSLWMINSLKATVCCRNSKGRFSAQYRYQKKQYRRKLSGITGSGSRPEYLTVLASGQGKRRDSGKILDAVSRETICGGLIAPFSPVIFNQHIFFLEQLTGKILMACPKTGQVRRFTQVPGFARGLAMAKNHLFVAASYGDFSIQPGSGVHIFHLPTGRQVGYLRMDAPDIRHLGVLGGVVQPTSSIRVPPAAPRRSLARAASITLMTGALLFAAQAPDVHAGSGPFLYQTGQLNPLTQPVSGKVQTKPVFADIDNDGDPDLFIGDSDGEGILFFKNIGTANAPNFDQQCGAENPLNNADPEYLAAPALGDLDGDGDLDVLVGTGDEGLQFYQNTGNIDTPIFEKRTGEANPFEGICAGSSSTSPALADLDDDGDPDLIVGKSDGRIRYFQNNGGSFVEQENAANPFDGLDVGSDAVPAIADINGDGLKDVVVGNADGELLYFQNTGTASQPAFTQQTDAGNPMEALDADYNACPTFTDIDGDDDLDLVVGGMDYFNDLTNTYYFKNTGKTTNPVFTEQTGNTPFNGVDAVSAATPVLVDIDGDGDLDAFIGTHDGTILYYQNLGTQEAPDFSQRTGLFNPLNGVDVGEYATPTFTDIDDDKDFDCFIGNQDGAIKYFRNTGSASVPVFSEQTGAENPLDGVDVGDAAAPTFIDIDGDGEGDQDALIGRSDGRIVYYQNQGDKSSPDFSLVTGPDKTFSEPETSDVGYDAAPVFVDLDMDGDADAVIGNRSGEINYFENVGSNTNPQFLQRTGSANPLSSVQVNWNAAPMFADIDSDGDYDCFVGNGNGHVEYYQNLYFSEPTGLSLSSAQVQENLTAGSLVGVFTTEDLYADDQFTYALVAGEGSTNNAQFTINGNELRTNAVFDYESVKSYQIRVRTEDSTGSSYERAFTIQVTDVNDPPTNLKLSVNQINENLTIGTVIGQFSAYDTDWNFPLTYSLVSGNGDTGNHLFAIDGEKLKVNDVLDYEAGPTVDIRIRATDAGGAYSEKQFSIELMDVNDSPTGVALSKYNMNEKLPAGEIVATLLAVDQDATDTFTFALVEGDGDTDNALFTIAGNQLKLSEVIEFASKTSVSIRVKVTDKNGFSAVQVLALTVNEIPVDPAENIDPDAALANVDTALYSSSDDGGGGCFIGSVED